MERPNLTQSKQTPFAKIPLAAWLIGGAVFTVALVYSVIFFVPASVQFSYAEKTCVSRFIVAPALHKAHSDDFTITYEDSFFVKDTAIVSTKVCFEPIDSLDEGQVTATTAPFGSWVAQAKYIISIPSAPLANKSDLAGKQISTAVPLKIQLSAPDAINTYTLNTDDKSAECAQTNAQLSCDVASLDLEHAKTYTLALHQSFKNTDTVLAEGTVETLHPLVLAKASVSDGQTIYDIPTKFSFTFDQEITSSDVQLVKMQGDTTEVVPTKVTTDDKTIQLAFEPLARETQYKVLIDQAIGKSGSSLAEPAIVSLTMSGGPKVKNVSIGTRSVARNATALLTFDQPIADDVDIHKFVQLSGLKGSITKRSATQLAVSIAGGDCTPFTISLNKGIKSGSNGEVSKDAWSYGARTLCGSSWVIGSSVKGRAIIAYSFGSGSKTLLFTGGIHGSEPSSTTTMQALVAYLQAYGESVPGDKRVVIVPNNNPDGIAAGTRYNARNVNLGRNFPTNNWSASIETGSGTHPTGGGTSPGSEPEAAALIKLVRQLKPRISISYHARGSLVGANKFADSVSIGDTYAKTVGYRTMYYNAEAVMGYPMTGELEDWMGEEMNIPAILIELPQHSGNYFSSQLPAIRKLFGL